MNKLKFLSMQYTLLTFIKYSFNIIFKYYNFRVKYKNGMRVAWKKKVTKIWNFIKSYNLPNNTRRKQLNFKQAPKPAIPKMLQICIAIACARLLRGDKTTPMELHSQSCPVGTYNLTSVSLFEKYPERNSVPQFENITCTVLQFCVIDMNT